MRIRGLDEETEEASEEFENLSGKIADLTKTAKTPGGISLFTDKDKTQYKSTYQLLKDISEIYDDLTDKQQAKLLETLAGKRGGQVLAGILGKENFKEVERAMSNMAEAAGSADDEMKIITESISYQLNALKQTWVGFLQDLIDRGVIQKFLENLTVLSEKFIELTEDNPALVLSGFATALMAVRSAMNGTLLSDLTSLVKAFSLLKNGKLLDSMAKPFKEAMSAGSAIAKETEEIATVTEEVEVLSEALEESGEIVSNKTIPAFGSLKNVLLSAITNPIFWAIAAIGGFVIAANSAKKAAKGLSDKAKELGDEYNNSVKDIDAYKEEVEKLKETINDSSSSYDETRAARERLLEIQDELIDKYGTERSKIDEITQALYGESDAFDNLIRKQWEDTKREFNTTNIEGAWDTGAKWGVGLSGSASNTEYMLAKMEDVSATIEGVTDDFELLNKTASQFGNISVSSDAGTGMIHSLKIDADNAFELSERLRQVRVYLEENGASKGLLRDIDKQITALDSVISQYESYYNQYVLNERILGDETGKSYEDEWRGWLESYSKYQEAVKDGNEKSIDDTKQYLLDSFTDLRAELRQRVDNEELTDAESKSILDAFRNTMPELQKEFAKLDLYSSLFDEVEVEVEIPKQKTQQKLKDVFSDLRLRNDSVLPDSNLIDFDEVRKNRDLFSEDAMFIAEATERAEEYVDSLDDIYKTYNGINNIDRDLIIWDDESLEANKAFIEGIYESFEEGAEDLKGSWSTVLGTSENFDGVEIAYTQMLQTDHGLVPLTPEEFQNYFDSIFNQSWDGDVFDAEKFIQLDAQGTDAVINGQMEHVANMIAAAEGQILNGIKLTADDVIAIGVPGFDEEGNDLLPGNESIFKGYSMHDVQAEALQAKYAIELVGEEVENTGGNLADNVALASDLTDELQEASEVEVTPKVEIPETRTEVRTELSAEGQRILDAAKVFTDAEHLLSMANKNELNAATDAEKQAYEVLQNEAEYLGVSVQELIDALNQYDFLSKKYNMSKSLKSSIGKLTLRASGSQQETAERELTEYASKLDEEEQEVWERFADSYQGNWWNFIRDFEAEMERIRNQVSTDAASFSNKTFSEQVNEMDKLKEAYTTFRENVTNKETKINLDISDVEELREQFADIESFDFEEFEITITSDTSSVKDIQQAFNEAATAYANHKISLEGINEQNREMIRTQLEMEGITKKSAENFTDVQYAINNLAEATENAEKAGVDLANITATETGELKLEGAVAPYTAQAIAILALQKQLAAGVTFGEQGNIDQIMALASAAKVGSKYLSMLAAAKSLAAQIDAGDNSFATAQKLKEATAAIEAYDWQADVDMSITVDPTSVKNSAAGAGKEAADALQEAFDKELESLKSKYERGELTLAEYLAQYKALIEKYFSDTEKYAEERAKAMHDYLVELKGYYDSAISGVTTLLSNRISAAQKSKDKAIKAINEEKDAAIKALEEQKKAIQKVIKEKQKQIKELEKAKKPYEDEIKAIQDANAERERQVNLQKSLYELERAQQQRTQFIYKNGQMVYQQDTDSIRDARKAKEDAEDEIRIAALQKQIDAIDKQIELLNEEIDLLNEESEAIDEQIEALNEFYDKLIKEQEEYWDSIIEKLENTKSKWEELAEMSTIASAWKDVGEVVESLGFSVEDVLNDAPGAFDAFKQAYANVYLESENYNKHIVAGVQEWANQTGHAVDTVSTNYAKASSDIAQATDSIDQATQSTDSATQSTENLGSAADVASGKVSNMGSSIADTKQDTQDLASGISDVNAQAEQLDPTKFDEFKKAVDEVAHLISDPEGGSIVAALETLNGIDLSSAVEQFDTLKEAVSAVSSALGGGGGGESNAPLSPNNGPGGSNPTGGSGGEGGGSLVSAIEAVKKATNENIGGSGGGASEGNAGTSNGGEAAEGGVASDGTAVGDFTALKGAVDLATAAIGTEEGGDSPGGQEGAANLVSAVTNFGKVNQEVMEGGEKGGKGVIQDWNDFNKELTNAENSLTNINDALQSLADNSPYEAEVKVTLILDGSASQEYTGTAIIGGKPGVYSFSIPSTLGLPEEGGEFLAQLGKGKFTGTAKFSGSANMNGNWAYEGGKTLIAEIGPELVVYPNGKFETFDKPQMVNLPKGSVIFNHLQTGEILNTKNQVRSLTGKSNLNGTVSNLIPYSLSNPEQYAQFMQLADALKSNTEDMRVDLSDIDDMTRDIQRSITNSTYNSMNQNANITFGNLNFTCTGITSADVLSEVGNALEKEFSGIALNAYKKAMAH